MSNSVIVKARMYDQVVDLTPHVLKVDVEAGGLVPNTLGGLLPPGTGKIELRNDRGLFDVVSSSGSRAIDTRPGPPVAIYLNNDESVPFVNWFSGGILEHSVHTGRKTATLNLVSPMGRLAGFHEQLLLNLVGSHRIDEIVNMGLSAVNWPSTGGTLESGAWPPVPRNIIESDETVSTIIMEMMGVTLKGRERVKTVDFLNTCSLIELARVYDTLNGAITLENRYTRTKNFGSLTPIVLEDAIGQLRTIDSTNPYDGVVNIFTGEHDTGQSGGNGDVPLLSANVNGPPVSLPVSITVPARSTEAVYFFLDLEQWDWIQNWAVVVTGVAQTDVVVRGGQTTVTVEITNSGNVDRTVQITRITGTRFRSANVRKIVRRISESIQIYGEREFRYPSKAVLDVTRVRDAADFTLAFTDGIRGRSIVSLPFRKIGIRALTNQIPYYDVGQMVSYRGITGFIDHAKYAIDAKGYADIALEIMHNERGRAWNLQKTNWGESQIIGA